jgi:hypothetical protein
MSGAQGVEERIRGIISARDLFLIDNTESLSRYLANTNNHNFGIPAKRFCSNILEDSRLRVGEKGIYMNFSDTSGHPDLISINKSPMWSDGIEALMNRTYYIDESDINHSLAAVGIASNIHDINTGGNNYRLYIASSEIARNTDSAIYDLYVKISDRRSKKEAVVSERYAMEQRRNNMDLMRKLDIDIKGRLCCDEKMSEDELSKLIKEDEKRSHVYFANKELRKIDDINFDFVPDEPWGSKFWYKENGIRTAHTFYPKSYDGHSLSFEDIGRLEEVYREDVFNILNKLKGSVQNKLDICMMIFDNKQKLETVYASLLAQHRVAA